jgi:2-polyprenyl-3-methyl-5-hydroxy-6-metoxy-1,4-benzoquinol methylase
MEPAVDERLRLDTIAAASTYGHGANEAMVRYSARVFARHWRGPGCLELGPAEGIMTGILARAFDDLTVVDGAATFCDELARRHPGATVVCSLFETFEPARTFDTILMGHVLEHVDDPRRILARARDWLAEDGVLIAAVPNARSLHREAAVIMGLLPDVHAFSPADHAHGHRRVYDAELLATDVTGAGLTIGQLGGYWLKPVSNAQLEASWTEGMLDAFMQLGERHPEIAAELYVVAHR